LFPPLTADTFGTKYLGVNYGVVLLGFGAGAIAASQVAGYFYRLAEQADDINKMLPAFIIASAAAVTGIVLIVVLKLLKKKKFEKQSAETVTE
jgi:OFA family oxalate/formate antiporter-like MFS transporter